MTVVESELQRIRILICDRFMIGFSVLGIPAAVISGLRSARHNRTGVIVILFCAMAITAAGTLFRKRVPYSIKAPFVVLLLAFIGVLGLSVYGLISAGIPFLIAAPLLAMLFLGWRAAVLLLAMILATASGMGTIMLNKGMLPELDLPAYLSSPEAWINTIVTIAAIVGALLYAFWGYANSLMMALTERQVAADEAQQSQKVALIALADLAEHRDIDSGGHVQRVARLSHEIAKNLNQRKYEPETCDGKFLQHIGLASILHDIGKVTVPDSVLFKPGRLTDDEWRIMQGHAENGADILHKAVRLLPGSLHFKLATQIARSHHERWDGSGYPDGLKGDKIPLPARIVAVADVFDALISERTYKSAWSYDEALEYIRQRGGQQFDAMAVDAFLDVIAKRDIVSSFSWNEDMALGHLHIDRDHRILLQLLNQISDKDAFSDSISVKFMLDELINYTHYHFSREEKLMKESGYQGLMEHMNEHEEFRAKVMVILNSYEQRENDIQNRVISELSTWLRDHIMGTDRLLIPYL